MLPSLSLLERIRQKIKNIENKQGEYKRKIHYCCYLLCYNSGLRISEAINFNLANKTNKGLYKITKTKGKKERLVYIPQKVIKELKKHDWKPNNTNRFNFYHFLRKIKRELNLPANIELTPHTLRRAFATYHAEVGLPLPLLSKLLGHSSIRTTALYWMNIYNEDDDSNDILTGKFWLKRPRKPKPESEALVNLEELPEMLIESSPQPLASELPPNYLSKIRQLEHKLDQIQSKKDEKIKELSTELAQEKEQNAILNHENNQLQQNLSEKDRIIKQLKQKLTAEQEKRLTAENNLAQEKVLLFTQRQSNHNFCQQLQTERKTNTNLRQKLHASEQTLANLQNIYQISLKDKENSQIQANYYENQLKTIAKASHQWHLEKQNEIKAQIVQPPPWRNK